MPLSTVSIEGASFLVEVEERHIPPPAVQQGSLEGADDLIARVTDLGQFIREVCESLYGAVQDAANAVQPDGVELTFGIKLGGEAGVPFVAKGTAEANVAITLKWDRRVGTVADQQPHV